MNKDKIEGELRKTTGQVESFAGRAVNDARTQAQGLYDQASGSVQNAYGQAKEAISRGADKALEAVSSPDFDALREDLAKLTQTIGQLVQNQASSTRERVMDAVGSATDSVTQTASVAQDKFVSLEANFESWIQKNPIAAVAIAVGVGVAVGKVTSSPAR